MRITTKCLSRLMVPAFFWAALSTMATAQSARVQTMPVQSVQSRPMPRGEAAGQMPTHVLVYYENSKGRVVLLPAGEYLPLDERNEVQLWLEAWNAQGRQWPPNETKYELVTQDGCGGRYEIERLDRHRFRVRVLRSDAPNCELHARLVSPRVIERPLRVTWGFGSAASYGRDEAEYVVERLYRALLLRDPDREGFYTAVREVDAGRVAAVVQGLYDSAEFGTAHRGWSTGRLLDSLYRGLLGRAPDSAAAAYQRRLADPTDRVRVVLEILASREFNDLLARNVVAGSPCESSGPSSPCDLRMYYERDGRTFALGENETLDLGADGGAQIWLETFDQYGRQFSRSDLRYRILADDDCSAGLDVHPLSSYRYSLRALAGDPGRCRLVVRLDSPRRIDRALDVAWEGSVYGGYSRYGQVYNREDAEFVVDRLYRTLLGRPAAADDFDEAVRQVQSGGVRALADSLTSSPDFLAAQRRMSSDQVLDSLYSGLIQRRPAEAGVYRDADGRIDYLAVVLQLLSSPEFRALLAQRW